MASKGGFKGGRRQTSIQKLVTFERKELLEVGTLMATEVRDRVFPDSGPGRDEHDQAFSPYSTKRIYVSKNSPPRPADMPAPRGATQKTLAAAAKTPSKSSLTAARGHTRTIFKTVRYDGGYDQYRRSTGRSAGANKNLTMSGQTRRAFNVVRATAAVVTLGFRTRKERARALDAKYGYMGLTARERRLWGALVRRVLLRKVRRNVAR